MIDVRLLATSAAIGLLGLSATPAFAANCAGARGTIAVNQVQKVDGGAAHSYAIELAAGQGVHIDLADMSSAEVADAAAEVAAVTAAGDAAADAAATPATGIRVCNAAGVQLSPGRTDVFDDSTGALINTPDGPRMRFVAPAAGRYMIEVAENQNERELLVRNRNITAGGEANIIPLTTGRSVMGEVGPETPQIYSFSGRAGQWVEIKATADDLDTALRLAGPTAGGNMEVLTYNDDTEGLNPVIKRRLPSTGEYLLQITSVVGGSGQYRLTVAETIAPPPPAPAVALRVGSQLSGSLANSDDVRRYTITGQAGQSYSIQVTAPYDAWVAVGINNPLEADGEESGSSTGFTQLRSADNNLEGTETVNFTMAQNGQLSVEVRAYGDTSGNAGAYTIKLMQR